MEDQGVLSHQTFLAKKFSLSSTTDYSDHRFKAASCTFVKKNDGNVQHYYWGQPKAGTGHKMLSVPFVFSMSRFQGPAFSCDKIVVIITLLQAIEGIPDKDCNFLGTTSSKRLLRE